ncbi:hypothetical protein [Marinitenerispora sediminis]|uniref:hypothetical protein n=1 Tax=Marinitenerispora sediminis TaxID=1931232 RepID=UPI001F2254AE|nr:hypothetical protein [Marinitenerispora sediminis]
MNQAILILTALAAVAVLAGVAFAVMGRGGQLARFAADHPPLDLPADRPVTGMDVSRIELPLALWGYHVRAVDEVLRRVAAALRERDERIAELEHRLAESRADTEPGLWYPRSPDGEPVEPADAEEPEERTRPESVIDDPAFGERSVPAGGRPGREPRAADDGPGSG